MTWPSDGFSEGCWSLRFNTTHQGCGFAPGAWEYRRSSACVQDGTGGKAEDCPGCWDWMSTSSLLIEPKKIRVLGSLMEIVIIPCGKPAPVCRSSSEQLGYPCFWRSQLELRFEKFPSTLKSGTTNMVGLDQNWWNMMFSDVLSIWNGVLEGF